MGIVKNSMYTETNTPICNDLNKNGTRKISRELQEQYNYGLNPFAPLKNSAGKSAPITAYFELILKYPELVGAGVDPTYYNLAKEALEFKSKGGSQEDINSRYSKSILRT